MRIYPGRARRSIAAAGRPEPGEYLPHPPADLREVAAGRELLGDQLGAQAQADHSGLDPVADALLVQLDAAGGHERGPGAGAADRPDELGTAQGIRREELDDLAAHLLGRRDLGRAPAAGHV